ncbi:MAG: hypothetical protein ACHQ50_02415 [Fimbriimonadales bacterium]
MCIVGGALVVCVVIWLRDLKSQMRATESQPARMIHPYRLSLKLTLDGQARLIADVPKSTSLAELLALPRSGKNLDDRIAPLETTEWRFEATVESAILEPDGDLMMEISSDGQKAAVEIPDPALCTKSPFYRRIVTLRSQVLDRLRPEKTQKRVQERAEISGIGFAGWPDSGTRTGVRIYPALGIRWLGPSGSAR